MTKRRTHSSIDKLPADLRDAVTRMIVDFEWPVDCKCMNNGKPTYENVADYCKQKGFAISESAIGRYGMRMRTISLMKQAGVIARETMGNMTAEDAPKTQKAAAEMATALILEFMASNDNYTSKQIKEISQAIRDCAQVSIKADQYIRQQITKKVEAAADSTKEKLTKAGVDRKLIQAIIDEHLGVIK